MDFKAPSAFMQGVIALLLLANFTVMLLAPSIFPGYKPPSEAQIQTLVNLTLLGVGWYFGSSQGNARLREINAQQQDKALAAVVAGPVAQQPVAVDDAVPIRVQEVPAAPAAPMARMPSAPATGANVDAVLDQLASRKDQP